MPTPKKKIPPAQATPGRIANFAPRFRLARIARAMSNAGSSVCSDDSSRTIDAVSTASNTITILSVTVNTNSSTTQFEDKSSAGIEPFAISDINVGDYVEARGQELPAGELTAVLIERDDADPDSELRGFTDPASVVTDSGAPGFRESFMILGVTVDTQSVEAYRDVNNNELSADEFWAVIEIEAAGGNAYLVEVKGTETGDSTLTARELQLEVE